MWITSRVICDNTYLNGIEHEMCSYLNWELNTVSSQIMVHMLHSTCHILSLHVICHLLHTYHHYGQKMPSNDTYIWCVTWLCYIPSLCPKNALKWYSYHVWPGLSHPVTSPYTHGGKNAFKQYPYHVWPDPDPVTPCNVTIYSWWSKNAFKQQYPYHVWPDPDLSHPVRRSKMLSNDTHIMCDIRLSHLITCHSSHSAWEGNRVLFYNNVIN